MMQATHSVAATQSTDVSPSDVMLLFGSVELLSNAWPLAMLAIGSLQLGASFAFVNEAVAWVLAGRTVILANTTTIWVVPLSLIFLRECIPLERWVAANLAVAGHCRADLPVAIDWTSLKFWSGTCLVGRRPLLWHRHHWCRARRPHLSMLALLPRSFLIASLMLLPVIALHSPSGTLGSTPSARRALAYIGLAAGLSGTSSVMEATARLPTLARPLRSAR